MEFCYNHPKSKAFVKCDSCGKFICQTCVVHEGRNFCPQCAGHFPAISHSCVNHPDNFAAFMCSECGKPLCKMDKVIDKRTSGNYIYKIWLGCIECKDCNQYKDYKLKMAKYRTELEEYLKFFKDKRCSNCRGPYSKRALFDKNPLISKIIYFFNISGLMNPTTRIYCKTCNLTIPFLSSIEEFNGLDHPKLRENAQKPKKRVLQPVHQGNLKEPEFIKTGSKEHPRAKDIIERANVCQLTWNEALEYEKSKQYEIFIQKAYTAIENGILSLIIFELPNEDVNAMLLEECTDILRQKGYSFPNRLEIAYWRRMRNEITHDNAKISEAEGARAVLFFKEIITQINLSINSTSSGRTLTIFEKKE